MPSFINSYQLAVGVGQAKGVLKIINDLQKTGVIKSDAEAKEVLATLKEMIGNKVLFDPQIDPQKIRSSDLNNNFASIFLNLYGLYTQVDMMDKTLRAQNAVSATVKQNVKKTLQRVTQDTLQFLFLRDNPEYTEAKFVDFSDIRNLSEQRVKAVVEPHSRTLRLPVTRFDRHNESRGLEATSIDIEVLSAGTSQVISKSFRPENALDQDQTTFWAETLLCDEILNTTYQDDGGDDVTVPGVVVKATITLSEPQFINIVQVLPFSPYPLEVVDIRIDGTTWEGYSVQPASFEWIDFIGPRVTGQTIEIYFHQKNFTYLNLTVPDWLFRSATLWDAIVDKELKDRADTEELVGLEYREALENPSATLLSGVSHEFDALLADLSVTDEQDQAVRVHKIAEAVSNILDSNTAPVITALSATNKPETTKKTGYVNIDKIQYTLGAFSIVVGDVEYASIGAYESAPFSVRGDIMTLDLKVDATQAYEDDFPLTSAEYSIALGSDTVVNILPTGTTFIDQEYLFLDYSTATGRLRFTPSGTVALYGNLEYLDTVSPNGLDVPIPSSVFNPDVLYTVSYTPWAGQDEISVNELLDSRENTEVFSSTDQDGRLQTRFYPYIAYDIVNDMDRWRRVDEDRGVWIIDPSGEALTIDGHSYGFAQSNLNGSVTATQGTITLYSGSVFPEEGVIEIDDERIHYSSITGAVLYDCIRGFESTVPASHSNGATVKLVVDDLYEPVRLFVNGQQARNITDYRSTENPAFTNSANSEADWQFIQQGRNVYLNKPVTDGTIEIHYNYKVEYVALRIFLRSHQIGTVSRTPEIDRFSIRLKSEIR